MPQRNYWGEHLDRPPRITDGQLRAFRIGKRLIRIRIQDLDDPRRTN